MQEYSSASALFINSHLLFAREQTRIWTCANTWRVATIRAYVDEQTLVALKEACIILLLRIKNLQNFSAK